MEHGPFTDDLPFKKIQKEVFYSYVRLPELVCLLVYVYSIELVRYIMVYPP